MSLKKTNKKQMKPKQEPPPKKIIKKQIDGTEYNRITGASCTACRASGAYTRNTLPWESGLRIRYHTCRRCGTSFKSIETD